MSYPPPSSDDPLPPRPPGYTAPTPPAPASPAPDAPAAGSPGEQPPAAPTPTFRPGYAQPVYPQPQDQQQGHQPTEYQPTYPATAAFPSYPGGPEAYQHPDGYPPGPYQPAPYQPGPPRPPRRSNVPLVAVIVAVTLLLCGGVAVAGVLVVRTVADKTREAMDDLPAWPTELPVPTEVPDLPGLPTDAPGWPGAPDENATPMQVVYEVTGDGNVDIAYTGQIGEAPKRIRDAKLPWRMEVSMTGASYVSVIAFRSDTSSGSVGCTATVDGEEVSAQDAEGAFAVVTCSKLILGNHMTSTDPLVHRMRPFGTTIFAEMSALAARTGAVNLGQGFPDTDGPPQMLAAAVDALRGGANQYPPGPGIAALRAAIAAHDKRFWGLDRDPDGEVLVTAGATEAIAATVLALCEAGDEVICFEPYYDSYAASIALAGAVRRPVTLRPGLGEGAGRYGFDPDELRAAFGPRTRLVLLNTPHNPTGKVFTHDELTSIADLCREHDVYAVTDEVYEHLVFTDAGSPHLPIAGLPGMADRTVRISSAGKTFSCTGWKIGWATGPADLISAVLRVKQFLTFVNGAPLQPAVAVALGLPDDYFAGFAAGLQARRDQLTAGLADAGFAVLPSEGTYFVTTDITPLGGTDGIDFCRELPDRCGVVAVPTQVFYDDPTAGRHLVRWAFCKREDVIADAVTRLRTRPGPP